MSKFDKLKQKYDRLVKEVFTIYNIILVKKVIWYIK